jgi:hypothetical protein
MSVFCFSFKKVATGVGASNAISGVEEDYKKCPESNMKVSSKALLCHLDTKSKY